VSPDELRQAISSQMARIVREERVKRRLSLNALAERAGLSRQMVSYVEQEERNPSLDTLLRIADVLAIPLDKLIRRARLAASSSKQNQAL
jgi:transcriptional regulator with XRE-family HTH domain